MSLIVGMGGGARSGSAAVLEGEALIGACAQERVTRTRGGRLPEGDAPWEALDLLLQRIGRVRGDVDRFVLAEGCAPQPIDPGAAAIGHHLAHASTAYLTSPYSAAAIVVADHDPPYVSVWQGRGPEIVPRPCAWQGPGFATIFSRFAHALGFRAEAASQRMEALGRLHPSRRDPDVDALLRLDASGIFVDPALDRWIDRRLAGDHDPGSAARAHLAAALQTRLGDLLLSFVSDVLRHTGADRLCLGGSLFYYSSMNTRVRVAGVAGDVFIPVDPGNAGLAVGAALHAARKPPSLVSPFLGPSYSPHEIKEVLDNCKLQYSWESEEGTVQAAVRALQDGRLVGWFDGGMEWGPRALGARSILASPMAPYVLENLNHFLKHREAWRGYSFSGLPEVVARHFEGPDRAPYMECEYRPRDPSLFRHALPSPDASVRVQTVSDDAPPRFRRLLEAVGEVSGLPLVINTSFNGFHEPIVCDPRDAVRVFYGTGLDLLVIGQFVLRK